jgi:ABC-type branched-subunit amino acid transport system substrate-binding protein
VVVAAATFLTFALAAVAAQVAGARALPRATVHVAMFVPASGYFTAQNALVANGAQVAAVEIDQAGGVGRSVKIVFSRIPLSPDANPAAAIQAAKGHGASVVILPCDVNAQPSLAAAASKAGLLTLSPCDPDPVSDRYPMEWPIGMAGNVEVGEIVFYASQENATTAYLLTSSGSSYVTELSQYFREAAKEDHVDIVGEGTVSLGAPNIAPIAASIEKLQPRAIFTPIFSPYLQKIIAALRNRGIIIPVYTTDGTDANLNLARYGAALQNDIIIGAFGFARPSSSQFFTDYHDTFGRSAANSSFPSLGYETIQALSTAIVKAHSAQSAAINSAFSKGFVLPGVTLADITFAGHGNHIPVTAAGVVRIIRGQRMALFASYPVGVISIPNP